MTTDFLWRGPAKPTRGPKPALTLEQIADAAIAIADAEGLAAVSMQRVATDLGFTKMALYRYVPGKVELVAVMAERVLGAPPELTAGNWRTGLIEWGQALLGPLVAHPWAQEATSGRRPIGPHEIGWTDAALGVLPHALTGAERLDTVATIAGHVRQMAAQTGFPENEMDRALSEHADRFPALGAALADVMEHGGTDDAFSFGLERILDGIEMLIDKRQV